MINKILSNGEEGVAGAALEVALKLDLAHGGWTDSNILFTNRQTSQKYNLTINTSPGVNSADEKNLLAAHGTLILFQGNLSDRLRRIQSWAEIHQKPCLAMDLKQTAAFEAAQEISAWAESFSVETMHVAGPSRKEDARLHVSAQNLLETVVYMGLIEANFWKNAEKETESVELPPDTLEKAVARLISALPLKDRAIIANMTVAELPALHTGLGEYIHQNFGLWSGNSALMESCRLQSKQAHLSEEGVVVIIIQTLWRQLRETHKLRRIK